MARSESAINTKKLFTVHICPKMDLIICYIIIYLGVYIIYTLFIQAIGREIGFNLMDSYISYYSTSLGISIKLNSNNLRKYSTNIRRQDNDTQMEKDVLLPKYLQNSDEINKIDTNLLDKHSKGGYSSYKLLFQINSVSYSNIFNYLDNIQEFIKGLEDNKIYTILIQAISVESQSYASILPRSLFIHRKSSANQFLNILSVHLMSYEYKYYSDDSYSLVITGREWYSLDQLKVNKEQFKEVEKRSDKIMESYLDSNKVFNSLFKAVNQYYGLIHINLSPQIIENLGVISGNDTYTLYDLNNFFSNVSTDTKNIRLLEFNHLNENIYIMLENNNVVHK
jgi:hypothetical protein